MLNRRVNAFDGCGDRRLIVRRRMFLEVNLGRARGTRAPYPCEGARVGFRLGAFRSEIPRTLTVDYWPGPTGECHDFLTLPL